MSRILDPIAFQKLCWPHINLYRQQREILCSLRDNRETVVVAGNDLGKDFVAAVGILWFFCSRRPATVVTTGVTEQQLEDVLWGEIRRLIEESEIKLPIECRHLQIRHLRGDGTTDPRSLIRCKVARQGEALLGRHLPKDIPRALVVYEEGSGIQNLTFTSTDTWAHCKLIIGNPWPCQNYFRQAVRDGDRQAVGNGHLYRKIIHIRAEDSPNVRLAMAQKAKGKEPTNEILIPGLLDWRTYQERREYWGPMEQSIGLAGQFYEGVEALMYPPHWLNESEQLADQLRGRKRPAKAIGVDTAEGGDKTAWAAVDEHGLIDMRAKRTPNTAEIPGETLAFAKEHSLADYSRICFDAGGGGREHADRLRSQGHPVSTVAFGAAASPEPRRGARLLEDKRVDREVQYAYVNRRAEMYGMLRLRMNPDTGTGFAIGAEHGELRRQLSLIPLTYTGEGRLKIPPKTKRTATSQEQSLTEIIGHSPDEADALVLAVYGMDRRATSRITQIF